MSTQDVISHADVKKYADYIIGQLEALKNNSEEEKESFVVDAFRMSNIFKKMAKFTPDANLADLDEDVAEAAFIRVRKALLEELKGKIDNKIYLVVRHIIENIPKNEVVKKRGGFVSKKEKRNIISEVLDLENSKEKIYKDQEPAVDRYETNYEEAIEVLRTLPEHPNVVNIKEFDPKSQRSIFEKLQMQTLKELLKNEKIEDRHKFLVAIDIIKDCLVGAVYLAENGLVLQDIKIDNLGVVQDGKKMKGELFDLEGLVKAGKIMDKRTAAEEYLVPFDGWQIMPGEMTYQFGVCLQKILEGCEDKKIFKESEGKIVLQIEALDKKMLEQNPDLRISLLEAKNELESILNSF